MSYGLLQCNRSLKTWPRLTTNFGISLFITSKRFVWCDLPFRAMHRSTLSIESISFGTESVNQFTKLSLLIFYEVKSVLGILRKICEAS
jgi:hypothetical protein